MMQKTKIVKVKIKYKNKTDDFNSQTHTTDMEKVTWILYKLVSTNFKRETIKVVDLGEIKNI